MYRILHPTPAECTFFSNLHGLFTKIDHICGYKTHLNKFRSTEIIQIIFPDNNEIKLEITNIKIPGKSPKYLDFKQNKKVSKKSKKYFEFYLKENTKEKIEKVDHTNNRNNKSFDCQKTLQRKWKKTAS